MKSYTAAVGLAAFATQVAAHGYLTTPTPRMPGDKMKAACGQQIFNQFNSDINGNIQGALQNANQPDYNAEACNLWQCKGMKLEDGGNVESFTAGQTVPIVFNIAAPHTGTANMSIVDTATNSIIGEPLKNFDVYASTATGVTDAEKNFDITIPSDLGSKCTTAGDCVLQFWWNSAEVDQTYPSCLDFTVGGSGSSSGSTPASSAAPSASAPAASSAAPSATPSLAQNVIPSATPTAAAGNSGSTGSSLPEQFTIQEFISWLKAETGAATKKARRHARAFF